MIKTKSCPRCVRGDLVLESDPGGYKWWLCLQCGHEIDANDLIPLSRGPVVPSMERHTVKRGGAR